MNRSRAWASLLTHPKPTTKAAVMPTPRQGRMILEAPAGITERTSLCHFFLKTLDPKILLVLAEYYQRKSWESPVQ
jgi:hypothetical protein